MRGIHAGVIVLVGVVVTNIGNYAFHLASAHFLGPSTYGSVVSLLTLATFVGIPLAGVQLAVARTVSRHAAQGEHQVVGAVFFRGILVATAVSAGIALVLTTLLPVLEALLNIGSPLAIVLTALITIPAVVTPVAWGVAQGLQRFRLLAVSMVLGTTVRLALLLVLILAGSRLVGAILATLIGSLASLAVAVWPLRQLTRSRTRLPLRFHHTARQLMPIVGGLLAITSLTSLDVIIAKGTLSSTDAGIYGGASVIGRLVLYVPAAIATVLLPKVSSRAELKRETSDIVGASLAVTLGFCAVGTAVYAAAPDLVATTALGDDFADAGPLLWLFGVAMTGYALLNVLLVFHLGHGASGMSKLLLGGAAVQLCGYLAFHDSQYELLGVSIATALFLLVIHELAIVSGLRMTGAWVIAVARVLRHRGGGT